MKNEFFKTAGIIGLILVIAAALIYAVRGVADQMVWIPLGMGLVGVVYWLISDWKGALEAATSRRARHGFNAFVLTLAVLALFGFAQAIIGNHSVSWDLSKNKQHTLSDQTQKTVKGLQQDILLYHFHMDSNTQVYQDFLKKIRAINPERFRFEMVSLNKRPMLAQQYAVRSEGTSVGRQVLR